MWAEPPPNATPKDMRVIALMRFGLNRKEAERKWDDEQAEQKYCLELERRLATVTDEASRYAEYWRELSEWRAARWKTRTTFMR